MSAALRLPPSGAEAAGTRTRACERLLELTCRIRDGLERDEWGTAAELEVERRGLVEAIFDGPPPAAELTALTALLREVVRVNDELVGLAEHRRRALEREAEVVANGRAAVRAYDAAGRARGA